MKLLVNKKEIKNLEDLKNSLNFKNQRRLSGEYAHIEYVPSNKEEEKKIYTNVGTTLYTVHNWYNDNVECTIQDTNQPNKRYFNEELSINYNLEKIKNYIKKDNLVDIE